MWQFSDFRPSHSTQKVVSEFCFVVLCVSSGVKLAGYGGFKFFLKIFWPSETNSFLVLIWAYLNGQKATPPTGKHHVKITNAKKVTVSVLYWYEKLSSLLTKNFWKDLERGPSPFTFFLKLGPALMGKVLVKSQKMLKSNIVYDHTKLKTPYPVRFAKLSSFRRYQYWGQGWLGNLTCRTPSFLLIFVGFVPCLGWEGH